MLYLGFNSFGVALCVWFEGKASEVTWIFCCPVFVKTYVDGFWYPCWQLFINVRVVKSSLRQAWGMCLSGMYVRPCLLLTWPRKKPSENTCLMSDDSSVSLTVTLSEMTLRDTKRHITACFCKGANWSFVVLLLSETLSVCCLQFCST